MTNQARQFTALAGLAATELFRQPACFLLVTCSVALTILVPLAVSHQLGQTSRLAIDSALAFQLVFGIILAGYAACATLHNETRSGTILVVFSKPVSRLLFFAAKFTAVASVLVFFTYCSAIAALLAERLAPRNFEYDTFGLWLLVATPLLAFLPAALLNFISNHPFIPRALLFLALTLTAWVILLGIVDQDGHHVAFGSPITWSIIPAVLLEGIALLLMATLAVGLAARLPVPSTVALLAITLFAGLIADHLATLSAGIPLLSSGIRLLLPDIQAYWPADRLAGGGTVGARVLGHAAAYAAAYGAGILTLGYAAFRNRQF